MLLFHTYLSLIISLQHLLVDTESSLVFTRLVNAKELVYTNKSTEHFLIWWALKILGLPYGKLEVVGYHDMMSSLDPWMENITQRTLATHSLTWIFTDWVVVQLYALQNFINHLHFQVQV